MGVLSLSSATGGKSIYVKVSTMDADLEKIAIEADWTGRQLFDTVCRIIGLREIWYFGLQFVNKKRIYCWLQMDKKVCKQEVPKQPDGSMHFLFLVKFYPEDVEEELIQDITRHLFFLQIKHSILAMHLYCSAEASVLLASYAVQAIHGDCSDDTHLELTELLPESVIKQYDMSPQMWEERIRRWWINNSAQSREDAEMEYLRVAQDLEMYGIQYFPICNSKESDLSLGVSAQGIGIYKGTNRITPRPFFSWSEIKKIAFKNKVFTMKTMDKSKITFRAKDMSINMSILDLCIGTHNLYLRRRQPDLLEVQQMKAQAKEQRIRRMQEQNRFSREREQRVQAEAERDRFKSEMSSMNEELLAVKEAMKKTEETAQLLAEKARVSEEEALVLSKRASEAEAECQRMKISQIKAEEMRMTLERKARDAELMAHRLIQESERTSREAQIYRQEFLDTEAGWPQAWLSSYALPGFAHYASHHQLMSSSSSGEGGGSGGAGAGGGGSAPTYGLPADEEQLNMRNGGSGGAAGAAPPLAKGQQLLPTTFRNAAAPHFQNGSGPPPDPSTTQFIGTDLSALRAEIDKSRAEYNERKKSLKEKMSEFRAEIESLKVEDRQSEHDRIHAANVQMGIDKYSTLRKSGAGSTKSRVQMFEGL